MKGKTKSGKRSESKPNEQKEIADAADFHNKRLSDEKEFESSREALNNPHGNYEYEQMIAEDANFNTKGMIAVAAFYIAEERGFAPGNEAADWLRAEIDIENSLRDSQGGARADGVLCAIASER